MREELPELKARAFADDTAAAGSKAPTVQSAADITVEFCTDSFQELNGTKKITWAVGSQAFKDQVKEITVG